MKKLLFLAALGAILLTPAMASAVSGSSGGGGSINWTEKVGKPENDPNAPSSYESYYKDTQKGSSHGGTQGGSQGEDDPDID